MENIAHTLAGLAVAKLAKKKLPESSHRGLFWTSIIASNLPDIDIATSVMFDGGKLNYLLHHRGHTHTLLIAIPAALLVGFFACRMTRKRSPQPIPMVSFLAVSVICILIHLIMDYWNIYGVHLFWPFDNHWQYGDAVFIVEPLLWFSLLPMAWFAWPQRRTRFFFGLVAIFGVILLSVFQSLLVIGFALLWFGVVIFFETRWRHYHPGLIAIVFLIAGLFIGSKTSKNLIQEAILKAYPDFQVDQVAVTPAPANPFCWRFYAITRHGDWLNTFVGNYSFLSSIVDPQNCFIDRGDEATAVFIPASLNDESLDLKGMVRQSIADGELLANRCLFQKFLQFARVPFWRMEDENTVYVGDLRFDNEPGEGFSEMPFDLRTGCHHLVPVPWDAPGPIGLRD